MQNRLNKLISFLKTRLLAIKKLFITILTYNNFEFLENRRDKRIKKI